jgi:peroxiredoxin
MNTFVKWSVGLYVSLVWSVAPAAPSAPASAPDFALKTDSGRNVRLTEQRGMVVLINFWASWCGPCRQEMPELEKLYTKYRQAGFVLWGVNVDDNVTSALTLAKKLNTHFPTLLDQEKTVSRLYNVSVMPSTVLVDREGKVRYWHRGYKPGYEKTYESQIRELLKE